MGTYAGTVAKNDLEGGFWELRCDNGDRYQLKGGDAQLRVEGQRVRIEGTVDAGEMGIGMTGPILEVATWTTA